MINSKGEKLTIYDEKSMVGKEHAKLIANKLSSLGSKVSERIMEDLKKNNNKKYALANLLYFACGGSTYKLDIDQIKSINNDQFSIQESAIIYLCEHSATR
ncbi:MAG: hypothetical protein PHD42_02630 [Dysgonamonadaceae bacterium]|nr:hypothetical protein [Dysgonamonadaceae bacterium]